jgi:hypothetical protein
MHIAAFHGPGYGGSDYHRLTVESPPDDAVARAEDLGYERLGVLGFSAAALRRRRAAMHPGSRDRALASAWHGTVPRRCPKLSRC